MGRKRVDHVTVAANQLDYTISHDPDDVLQTLICTVATAATSSVSIKDGSGSSIPLLPANTPVGVYTLKLGIRSRDDGWKITTGTGVTALAVGSFLVPDGPPSPPPVTTVFLDTFTDTDNDNLETQHTPDTNPAGGGWTLRNGGSDFKILSNSAARESGDNPVSSCNAGVTTGTLIVNLTLATTDDQIGLYVSRDWDGTGNGWLILAEPASTRWRVHEYGGGGFVHNETYTFSAGAQEWKVVCTATTISVYVNSVLIFNNSSAPAFVFQPYGTMWGMGLYDPAPGGPTTTFQSFEVTDP